MSMETRNGTFKSKFNKKSVKRCLKAKYRSKRFSKKIPKPLPVHLGLIETTSSSVQLQQANATSEQQPTVPVQQRNLSGTRREEAPPEENLNEEDILAQFEVISNSMLDLVPMSPHLYRRCFWTSEFRKFLDSMAVLLHMLRMLRGRDTRLDGWLQETSVLLARVEEQCKTRRIIVFNREKAIELRNVCAP